MADYIKREAAMLEIDAADFVIDNNFEGGATLLYCDDVVDRLSAIPAADVRPVVTCADCKHNNACLTQAFVEDASRVPFDSNTFFCADGKRADDV